MAHLAEDTAVRRGDAFDGEERVVGVEVYVRGRLTVRVDVLCGDLPVCGELADQLLARKEAPFAVGDRDGVHLADLGQGEPRGLVRGNAGADNAALMTGDGVEGQGRAVLIRVDDLAVGNQTELDQRLEAVADAADQTVALIQQRRDAFPDLGVSEEGEASDVSGTVTVFRAFSRRNDLVPNPEIFLMPYPEQHMQIVGGSNNLGGGLGLHLRIHGYVIGDFLVLCKL